MGQWIVSHSSDGDKWLCRRRAKACCLALAHWGDICWARAGSFQCCPPRDEIRNSCLGRRGVSGTRRRRPTNRGIARIPIPSQDEFQKIELSFRLYAEYGAELLRMTAMANLNSAEAVKPPITFILKRPVLVTVRCSAP